MTKFLKEMFTFHIYVIVIDPFSELAENIPRVLQLIKTFESLFELFKPKLFYITYFEIEFS